MKTYETERKDLYNWLLVETNKHSIAMRKRIAEHKLSRDSDLTQKQHETEMEYNRRLIELKKKYNIK